MLKDLIDFVDFMSFIVVEQFSNEVRNLEDFLFIIGCLSLTPAGIELLSNNFKQKLERISVLLNSCLFKSLYKLLLPYVTITLSIYRGESLLQCEPLVWEYFRSNSFEDLCRSLEDSHIIIVYFLAVESFQ
jgi:hypothetical protein